MDPERLGDAARPFVEDLEPGDARSFAIHSGLGVATPLLDALGMRPGSKKKGRSPGYVSRTQYTNQDTVSFLIASRWAAFTVFVISSARSWCSVPTDLSGWHRNWSFRHA